MRPVTFQFINLPVVEPSPPDVCERIATNQIGQFPQQPLADFPGSGRWTGGISEATGIHQRYEYQVINDLVGEPDVVQQFLVMSEVVGVFQQDEPLVVGSV